MKNKSVLLIVITIVILLGSSVLFFNKNKKLVVPVNKTEKPTEAVADQKEYKDPSGFSFNYPVSLKVIPQSTNDQDIYSFLKLESGKIKGSISIKLSNTQLTSVDEYFKSVRLAGEKGVDVKLGDLQAKQITTKDKIITVAVDDSTLHLIEVNPQENKEFWVNANKKIIESFAFVPPSTAPVGPNSGPDTSSDIEEVIE